MTFYNALSKQKFSAGEYTIVPIRLEDKYKIMQWRNEQIYHLRQSELLTKQKQDVYFDSVVSNLFEQEKPDQILFSYLEGEKCIGYGGLVHINWLDKNAEISFIMDTRLEENYFEFHWTTFLGLLEQPAWEELNLHKVYTYAFDLRPRLYIALEKARFGLDTVLKEHCFFDGKFLDVKVHAKFNKPKKIRKVKSSDLHKTYVWANNPIIRKYAFDQKKISLADHGRWFYSTLEDPNREYYMLEDNGISAGSIRFDIETNNTAKINYLLDPNFAGRGLGTYLLEHGLVYLRENRPSIEKVYGLVFQENDASVRIFEKLAFEKVSNKSSEFKFEKILK